MGYLGHKGNVKAIVDEVLLLLLVARSTGQGEKNKMLAKIE